MSLDRITSAIRQLEHPKWVNSWRVEEVLDSDDEPMLQVWLEVDDSLDVQAIYDELGRFTDAIRRQVQDAGVTDWVHVTLTNPIKG